jgi:uncharacterized membrane protein
MPATSGGVDVGSIYERLAGIERRLSVIENRLEHGEERPSKSATPELTAEDSAHREEELENRIGGNWFPRVSITVLVIGIAFLLTFPYQGFPSVLPSLFGYALVGGAFVLARRWREAYPDLARYVQGGALVLLFFTTLRLHFFTADPPVTDRNVEFVILLLVVIAALFAALRTRSQFLIALSLTAGNFAALLGSESWIVILVITVSALALASIAWKREWLSLLVYGTALTYVTHLMWVLNSPILGNGIGLLPFSMWNCLPLLLYAIIFASALLFRKNPTEETGLVILSSLVNGLGAGGLFVILTIKQAGDAFALYQAAAAVLFLCLAVAFWKKEESVYSTFFYAMTGYMAMSAAMIAQFVRPDYFILLAWQSLLVVSTAVWFRSQFIVIVNFIIYLILFLAYAITTDTVHVVSLSFGIVAVASARILNWQKDRLELKTEMMRNAYLACAFFIFPFALYHALPAGYVSISWVVVALFYYAMSILVKSRKYRLMAFLTLLLTIGRVAIVDSVSLEPTFRILSFLVLGTVMFLISMRYAKKRVRQAPQ